MVESRILEVMAHRCTGSQAREGCESYLKGLEASKVRDLQDIIKFNEDNKEIEFDAGKSSLNTETSMLLTSRSRFLPQSKWTP